MMKLDNKKTLLKRRHFDCSTSLIEWVNEDESHIVIISITETKRGFNMFYYTTKEAPKKEVKFVFE